MEPLVIPDDWTLNGVESAHRLIAQSSGAPLQVNKDWVARRKGAMHDAARLQLLATWARNANDKSSLRFHEANSVDAVLEELCDYAPGIAALRLSSGVSVGGQTISRREALKPASSKMISTDNMEWANIVKGRTIDFTCVSGSKVQYLRPLFSSRSKLAVKRKESMYQMLRTLSSYVAKSDSERIPEAFLQSCAVFASELMKNTQEHATRDCFGNPYLEHTEGLIVSWIDMDQQFAADFQGHPLLKNLWERETKADKSGRGGSLRCLQLSFFDTGPGFAARATGVPTSELSTEQERGALLQCLQKNNSTKSQIGAGNGIPDVIEVLREIGGMISIRSGRLFVFNSFQPNDTRELFDFADWHTNDLAEVVGAVVTLLVPIRK